jgi:MoxR-like ATPase
MPAANAKSKRGSVPANSHDTQQPSSKKAASGAESKLDVSKPMDALPNDANSLGAFLLDPERTLEIAAAWRWRLEELFEHMLRRSIALGTDESLYRAAVAISKLLPSAPHILEQACRHFRNTQSILAVAEGAPSPEELSHGESFSSLEVLLTVERLLDIAPTSFSDIWNWEPLVRIIQDKARSAAVRGAAARVMARILGLSETQLSRLVEASGGTSSVPWGAETRQEEEGALEVARLISTGLSYDGKAQPKEPKGMEEMMGKLDCGMDGCVRVGSVLLPVVGGAAQRRPVSSTGEVLDKGWVDTPSTRTNVNMLATATCMQNGVLLEGPSGSGKTSLVKRLARLTGRAESLIHIYLDNEMDSKTLLGSYVCSEVPGQFEWRSGALTQAVERGCWVLIEDLDLAPLEVLASLTPLLETGKLYIPSRDQTIVAREGFQLFGTRTTGLPGRREGPGLSSLLALCVLVPVRPWPQEELEHTLSMLFPSLHACGLSRRAVSIFSALTTTGPRSRRVLTARDVIKFCARFADSLTVATGSEYVPENQRERILREGIDCFVYFLPAHADRLAAAVEIGKHLDVIAERVRQLMQDLKPQMHGNASGGVTVGRIHLSASDSDSMMKASKLGGTSAGSYCGTHNSLQTLEAIAACVSNREACLLVGETGTGKTSAVQHLATQLGRKLLVVNLNQQTDASDLLGGYKPLEVRRIAQPLFDRLMVLLPKVTSKTKNTAFLRSVQEKFEAGKWKNFTKLLLQVV